MLRTADAIRIGELLIHPTLRQLYRKAVEQAGERGSLEISTWLDAVPVEVANQISAALMEGHLAEIADPTKFLRALASRLELLRVEAEIAMNDRLQREARARGDDQAVRALIARATELQKTREGLKQALQRP